MMTFRLTAASRVLLGLLAGFVVGLAAPAGPVATSLISVVTPVGTVFVNLIRMTAIPLIASMLIVSLGRARASAAVGHSVLRSVAIAIALLAVAASATAVIAQVVLSRVAIDRTSDLLQGTAATPASASAPLASWLTTVFPDNIIRAAAEGSVMPVILFAGLFGLALANVDERRRDAVLRVAEGVADAMQQIVRWILHVAPLGVFALAVPLAARVGMAAAGTVVVYIVLVVVLTVLAVGLLVYPTGIWLGPLTAAQFTAACAPAQSIAFAARSSLAALPVMVDSAERIGLTSAGAQFVLPLAATLFHFGAAVAQTAGAVFLARLYGIELSSTQLVILVITVVFVSFAVPGVPGGSIIGMVPVLSAANLPVEGIAILLAVDTIPDMFRTTANTTGAMMLAIVAEARSVRCGAAVRRPT